MADTFSSDKIKKLRAAEVLEFYFLDGIWIKY
jgi:hypothetical protein